MIDVRLVYSPDDKGYYFDKYVWDEINKHPGHFFTSGSVYPTKADAVKALKTNKIKWKSLDGNIHS